MTLPATIAVTTAAIDLLFGLLVLGISASPGWRAYRWVAAAALTAAAYALTELPLTMASSDDVVAWTSRFSLVAGGLNGSTWYFFTARLEGRALYRSERILVAGALVFCALALIPNVLISSTVNELSIPMVATTYRDAVPTALGVICYGYYCFGLLVIAVRLARRAFRGDADARLYFFGFVALLATAISDSLTGARVWPVPYLLTVGFLGVVVAVCFSLVLRFVASARELAEAQEKLVARERLAALGELSAVVAHEVRNPLGVIYNAVAHLRRVMPKDDANAPLVGMLQEEAERLNRVVSSLLQFSRPEDVTLRQTSVRELMQSAARAVLSAAEGAAGQLDVDESSRDTLWCDRQMMEQALINLLENALASPGRRGPVRLRSDRRGDLVRLIVIDDGAGVTPGQEDHIFKPFFTTRARGTGLGLAVVRRVAEAHGGTATVESTPGGGATFVIALPSIGGAGARAA